MAKSVFLPLNQCSICVSWFFLGRRQMWASGGGSCYPEKPIILYVGNWNTPLNSLPFQSLPSRSVTVLTSFLSSLLKSSVGLHCYQVQVQTHKLGGSQEALCTRFQVTSAASPFCHIPCPPPFITLPVASLLYQMTSPTSSLSLLCSCPSSIQNALPTHL